MGFGFDTFYRISGLLWYLGGCDSCLGLHFSVAFIVLWVLPFRGFGV